MKLAKPWHPSPLDPKALARIAARKRHACPPTSRRPSTASASKPWCRSSQDARSRSVGILPTSGKSNRHNPANAPLGNPPIGPLRLLLFKKPFHSRPFAVQKLFPLPEEVSKSWMRKTSAKLHFDVQCSMLDVRCSSSLTLPNHPLRNNSATLGAPLPSLPFHVSCSMFRVSCSSPSPNPLIFNNSPLPSRRPPPSSLRPFFSLPLLTAHCSLLTAHCSLITRHFFSPPAKKNLAAPPFTLFFSHETCGESGALCSQSRFPDTRQPLQIPTKYLKKPNLDPNPRFQTKKQPLS